MRVFYCGLGCFTVILLFGRAVSGGVEGRLVWSVVFRSLIFWFFLGGLYVFFLYFFMRSARVYVVVFV